MSRPMRDASGRGYIYHGRHYDPFRAPRFRWLPGVPYQKPLIHHRFPREYLIVPYFLYDYADYGLDTPPDDTQWVRYGDDLVLVDLDTDEILDVIPGVFMAQGQGPDDEKGPPPEDGPAPDYPAPP
jgi:Ni/Co efflux regulator RcnB